MCLRLKQTQRTAIRRRQRRGPQWLVPALALDALLWLQPLHRLARRRLGALAELEADAWAARLLRDPRALAESLAACAERLFATRSALWSAGMVTGSSHGCSASRDWTPAPASVACWLAADRSSACRGRSRGG